MRLSIVVACTALLVSTAGQAPAAGAVSAAPSAPQSVAVGGAIGRAYVTWQPPGDNGGSAVTGYRVYRGTTASNLAQVGSTSSTAFLNRGLAVGKTYYFAVAATTSAGVGERSAPQAVAVPAKELILSIPTASGADLVAQSHRGAPVVPIVADGHDNTDPAVSPDGRWLAYASDATGVYRVYVRPADGSGYVRRIQHADPDEDVYEPSWSPDGVWLAATLSAPDSDDYTALFRAATGEYGNLEQSSTGPTWTAGSSVVSIDTDSGRLVESILPYGSRTPIPGGMAALDAEVSPDGEWVAFSRVESMVGDTPTTSIRLLPRRGGTATVLAAPGGLNTEVTWAPDGTRLYFTHAQVDEAGHVATPSVLTVSANGSGLTDAGAAGLPSTGPAVRYAVTPPRATPPKPPTVVPDFDADGTDDIGVFRPSNGTWYVRNKFTVQYGKAGDVPVPADFTGDRRSEIAVWRPSNGTWYVRGHGSVQFGVPTDIPVPADYTGDGRADIAVFRPSTGTWHIRGVGAIPWGRAGDVPLPGYWRGSISADIAVWRPSNGTWYFRGRTDGWAGATFAYGRPGDVPVRVRLFPNASTETPSADDVGLLRPSTGEFFRRNPRTGWSSRSDSFSLPAQTYGSVPMGLLWNSSYGDYVIFQPTTGTWCNVIGANGVGQRFLWGRRGDLPL